MSIRSIATAFIILLLVITIAWVDYCWTKNSLEDMSGKEVSPETVIWTMLKTGNRRWKRKITSMKLLSIPAAPGETWNRVPRYLNLKGITIVKITLGRRRIEIWIHMTTKMRIPRRSVGFAKVLVTSLHICDAPDRICPACDGTGKANEGDTEDEWTHIGKWLAVINKVKFFSFN